ncbi:hypothetical protein C5748_12810 [Phyllobacterium phragmitis]|uniref:histidine kinase n=1 Tax=Phyllobacterium phragmitis TaxID=2670329 RepID=A0A2S9IRE2_9HYPH|nr:PAS domain-containing sensor histidine kinase [Phyllobacterium phragmitis]PRD43083.1 hypothetical protein C5748_12810 [Phyllobacterium phragmitis]
MYVSYQARALLESAEAKARELEVPVVHPDDAAIARQVIEQAANDGQGFDLVHRLVMPDGSVKYVHAVAHAAPNGSNGRQYFGAVSDITESKEAEERARQAEAELRAAIDTIPVNVWTATSSGEHAFYNQRLLSYSGFTPESAPSSGRVLHPEDAPRHAEAWEMAVEAGTSFECEVRLRGSNGQYRWFLARAEPVRDEHGNVTKWYGTDVDIDDLKRAEQALVASEQRLRRLVDTVPSLIWCTTAEGEPTYINKRLAAYSGLAIEDLDSPDCTRLSRAIETTIHPDDMLALRESLMHSFRTGETFAMKYRRRRADGVYRWVEGRADPLRDEDGRILEWYGVTVDIDDEIRAQEALREAQDRLARASQAASLAELSASIAHEVTQPLAAIAANGEAGLRWLGRPEPDISELREVTESIVADARRAVDIVARIRAMAARQAPQQTLLSLDDVIREALQFLHHEVQSRAVTVSHQPAPIAPRVLADRIQLQQVIINLTLNSMQAISQAGGAAHRITIRTIAPDPATVCCTLEDSGPGIEPEHLGRLFQSFFTTKEGGMGMGLPICRSIIETHGGHLTADNNSSDGGARFSFTLPAASNSH